MPSEEAQEIAGSAEDAALEAVEEAIEVGGEQPIQPASVEPGGEGHAAPTEDALEIAGTVEDAALEAAQEASDAVAVEAAIDEDEGDDADIAARQTGRPRRAPGSRHRSRGRRSPWGGARLMRIPMRSRARSPSTAETVQEESEEVLTEPIATAAIDLDVGVPVRPPGQAQDGGRRG